MKTEEIKIGEVSADEAKELFEILDVDYGFSVIPGTLGRFMEKTASSRVYRCDTKEAGTVVLKRSFWYRVVSEEDITLALRAYEKAYSVSEELRNREVALPRVFRNAADTFVTPVVSDVIVVSAFIPGEHFSSRDREWISGGEALGKFHRAGKEYISGYPHEVSAIERDIPVEKPYEDSRSLYAKFLRSDVLNRVHECSVPEVCGAVRQNIQVIDKVMAFVDRSGVNDPLRPGGILHNDFNVNNGLYRQDGSFASFLDIDQVGVGPYIWDVGNTIASFCTNFLLSHPEEESKEKIRLFLRAYHREFPLPPEEYSLILAATQRWDLMRILRSLRRHHYENNRLPELLPKIKDRLIPRLEWTPRVFSYFTSEWAEINLT